MTIAAGISVAVALIAVVRTLLLAGHINANGGLGYDGINYDGMVRGVVQPAPWGQRIVLPELIRLLHLPSQDIPRAFLLVNMAALAAIVAGAFILARRLALAGGADPVRARAAALIVGSLLISMTAGFRWIWFYPVLVDPFASALGVWWYASATTPSRTRQWLGVPLAGLAAATHQFWGPIIVAGALARIVLARDRSDRRIFLAGIASTAVGVLASAAVPTHGRDPSDTLNSMIGHIGSMVHTSYGVENLTFAMLVSFGLLPITLIGAAISQRRRLAGAPTHGASARSLAAPMLVMTACCLLESVAVGGDEQRHLFYAGAPFILAITLGCCATRRSGDLNLVLAILVSLVIWQPFHVASGSHVGYGYFSPQFAGAGVQSRLIGDLRRIALPAVAWIAIALTAGAVARWRRVARTVSPPGPPDH
ncbi:MAG TPA: hypothetical protein VNN74_02260 [Candidatus Micrarchaeia archaeon]|nr:hypothetical protein [Candidatus Micrarchaeia archaeon]